MAAICIADLLTPIPGENPAGSSLRDSALYPKVRRALSGDQNDSIEYDGAAPSQIDLTPVVDELSAAIKTRSKDLQLCGWLATALARRDGFTGIAEGMDLISGLSERYWDGLYPRLDETGVSPRMRVFLKTFGDLAQVVHTATLAIDRDARLDILERTAAEIDAGTQSAAKLKAVVERLFGHLAPEMGPLDQVFKAAARRIGDLVVAKELTTVVEVSEAPPISTKDEAPVGEVEKPEQAIVSSALKCLAMDPSVAASYLTLRAVLWPNVALHPTRVWSAPETRVRRELKALYDQEDWPSLLKHSEECFATGFQAWIDLQRYTITACEKSGYDTLEKALQATLKCLFKAAPSLLQASFDDSTALADDETRRWAALLMAGESLQPIKASAAATTGEVPEPVMRPKPNGERREVFYARLDSAARLMEDEHHRVARPLLEDLAAEFDTLRLQEWEGAAPLMTILEKLHECMLKTGVSEERRLTVFERICRLDPERALLLPS